MNGAVQRYGKRTVREGIDDAAGTEISQGDDKPNGHASRRSLPLSTARPPVTGARSNRSEQETQEEYGKIYTEVSPTEVFPRRTHSNGNGNAILSRALSRQRLARTSASR